MYGYTVTDEMQILRPNPPLLLHRPFRLADTPRVSPTRLGALERQDVAVSRGLRGGESCRGAGFAVVAVVIVMGSVSMGCIIKDLGYRS